jgi:hypothetical protein
MDPSPITDGLIGDEGVHLGGMLFTLVEPHPGHEVDYHRWYERDHFYSGCLEGPWLFAGRRWVATRELKDLRAPADSPIAAPLDAGSFLATYWILKGRFAEHIEWGTRQVHWLHDNGRMFPHRDHVHTFMYVNRWTVRRDPDGVPPELALDHPFPGLLATMVRANDDDARKPLSTWLRDELLPEAIAGTPAALVVGFTPIPMPDDAPVDQDLPEGMGQRQLLLWFLDEDPRSCSELYADLERRIATSGLGRLDLAAPFIPTIPGTDTYCDELD